MTTASGETAGVPWSRLVGCVSATLVALTAVNFHLPELPIPLFYTENGAGWPILEPLSLAREHNIAAWWSGLLLFTAGLLAYQQVDGSGDLPKPSAFVLALILVGLSCDEIASVHERIGLVAPAAQIPLGIVGVLLLGYAIGLAWKQGTRKKPLLWLSAGFALFGSVALQEVLEHSTRWPTWLTGIRAGVEEGTELLGMFLILGAVISTGSRSDRLGWRAALPRPSRMLYLGPLITAAWMAQLMATLGYFAHLTDLDHFGNMTAWYTAAVYGLLAFGVHEQAGAPGWRHWVLFSILLACSMDAVAAMLQYVPMLFPSIEVWLPGRIFEPTGVGRYALHMLALAVGSALAGCSGVAILGCSILALLGALACLPASLAWQLTVPALLVFGAAWSFSTAHRRLDAGEPTAH